MNKRLNISEISWAPSNNVAVSKILIRYLGNIKQAYFLTILKEYYHNALTQDDIIDNKWFIVPFEYIEENSDFSKYQITKIIEKLVDKKIMETTYINLKLYCYIDTEYLLDQIELYLEEQNKNEK